MDKNFTTLLKSLQSHLIESQRLTVEIEKELMEQQNNLIPATKKRITLNSILTQITQQFAKHSIDVEKATPNNSNFRGLVSLTKQNTANKVNALIKVSRDYINDSPNNPSDEWCGYHTITKTEINETKINVFIFVIKTKSSLEFFFFNHKEMSNFINKKGGFPKNGQCRFYLTKTSTGKLIDRRASQNLDISQYYNNFLSI